MGLNSKGLWSGIFFLIVGVAYGAVAVITLPIGTAMSMGPGYFPLILSSVLAALGVYITVQSLREAPEPIDRNLPARAIICIGAATILFAALFEPLGIFPCVFLSTMLASAAQRSFRPAESAAACASIAALCAAVFGYFLGLPVPIVGEVFGPLSF